MYIVRVRTETEIRTFKFELYKWAEQAMMYFSRTTADAFLAQVETESDTNGEIIKTHKGIPGKRYLVFQTSRYRCQIGTEKECYTLKEKIKKEKNIDVKVGYLIGPIWNVYFELKDKSKKVGFIVPVD